MEWVALVRHDAIVRNNLEMWKQHVHDAELFADISGDDIYPDVAREQVAMYERYQKAADIEGEKSFARLQELAPPDHTFNPDTGRYEEKYVYPVALSAKSAFGVCAGKYDLVTKARMKAAQDILQRYINRELDVAYAFNAVSPPKASLETKCECGAHKASGAPRGSMHSSWCGWFHK